MFVKLLHGLQSCLNKFVQCWTKDNLPPEVMTKHDFKDYEGPVPAIPYDESGIKSNLNINRKNLIAYGIEDIGINTSTSIKRKYILGYGIDPIGVQSNAIMTEKYCLGYGIDPVGINSSTSITVKSVTGYGLDIVSLNSSIHSIQLTEIT